MTLVFSPGPFLYPEPIQNGSGVFSCRCYNNKFDLNDIRSIQVDSNGITFRDSDCIPVFQKFYRYLAADFWLFIDEISPEDTFVFPRVPRILGDVGVRVVFDSASYQKSFIKTLQDACPTKDRAPEAGMIIYALEPTGAKRLIGHKPLQEVIHSTINDITFSRAADLLVPVHHWHVYDSETQVPVNAVRRGIHRALQSRPPPAVVLSEGSPPNDIQLSDADTINTLSCSETLPAKPTWPLTTIPPPLDGRWLQTIAVNNGVHRLPQNDGGPALIFLPLELVRWYLAALVAAENLPDSAEAAHSLLAATASIKATLVREWARLWVTEDNSPGELPLQVSVEEANSALFDVAQNDEKDGEGMIGVGDLVETAWLGRPHRLVLDQEGWLQFALDSPRDGNLPQTDPGILTPSQVDSDDSQDWSRSNTQEQERLHRVNLCDRTFLKNLCAPESARFSALVPTQPSTLLIRPKRAQYGERKSRRELLVRVVLDQPAPEPRRPMGKTAMLVKARNTTGGWPSVMREGPKSSRSSAGVSTS
ncbi:hypothetical protein C8R46DRAFT_1103342 [Mycena filopes]|nr:hypothetical protein C8R46DRAFT_1103342 [Mycena filopes]